MSSRLNFTNSAQGVNLKKLGHFVIDVSFEKCNIKWSSFWSLLTCIELVKLSTFTNSAQGVSSLKLGHFINNNILENH